jgi:hypothetical protein
MVKKRSIMVFLLCCVSGTIYFGYWMVMVTEWISTATPRFACLWMGFLAGTAKFDLSIFGRRMSSFFLLLSFQDVFRDIISLVSIFTVKNSPNSLFN